MNFTNSLLTVLGAHLWKTKKGRSSCNLAYCTRSEKSDHWAFVIIPSYEGQPNDISMAAGVLRTVVKLNSLLFSPYRLRFSEIILCLSVIAASIYYKDR